jgi:hypothetical protein
MEQEKKIVVSKIGKKEESPLSLAIRYYSLLSVIGDMGLTQREIQLIGFTAIKGNISYSNNRQEFCTLYNTSSPTVNNTISKLKKRGLLVKDGDKIKVAPKILVNFNNKIIIQLSLSHG